MYTILNKQVQIYSVDTSSFYNDKEMIIHRMLNKRHLFIKELERRKQKAIKNKESTKKYIKYIKKTKKSNKKLKKKLYKLFKQHNGIRQLRHEEVCNKNKISVFDSVLIRTIGVKENHTTTDLIVVQAYFFEVIEDIIKNGFLYNGEKYICLTASAGQIRTKKTVFIKEKVLKKHIQSLMCGLTVDKINHLGGININKYLAYLALCNSATDPWDNFDITKSIVVDDMETSVNGLVDFISDKTYEITRQNMEVMINHTDGCGMILPRKSKKSMMVRLPWVKGLLIPFPFDKFLREKQKEFPNKNITKITDIYGKEYDILNDDIEIIFTKSQFKMWKYYQDWQQYIEYFLEHNCQAGKCNEEENEFSYAKLNYQMLQTLTDITDNELKTIAERTKNNILNIGKDRNTMLRVLGVVKSNTNKNYLQQALEIYPELLRDRYSKQILKDVKKSIVREGRSGKLDIDGKYTFICPDLYAFCEYLFLGIKKPNGLLKDGQVFCKLYKDKPKIDCLRSPHLYREHAIRNNIVDKEKSRWFITNGLYTSTHDMISKILMFDVDGDKSLVCADKTIIKVAERNMKDIVPLYYDMAKAEAEKVNNNNIFKGLRLAYIGGNIGVISNDITKIWNSDKVDKKAIKAIKLLCMENNFIIDYAKTLYKPIRPEEQNKLITSYTKSKTPHFFIYAKKKKKNKVEPLNNSVINRLEKIIPNTRINFNAANVGNFNYKMLMLNPNVNLDNNIINTYKKLDLKSHFMMNYNEDESNNIYHAYLDIRDKLLEINPDKYYVTDVLVKYLYVQKKSNFKTTLWECFGDVIVENLKRNIKKPLDDGFIQCELCGKRIKATNNISKYCNDCFKKERRKYKTEKQRLYRLKRVDN